MPKPLGAFIRALDANDRVALPPALVTAYSGELVMGPGFEHFIRVYTLAQWEALSEKLDALDPNSPDDADLLRFHRSLASEAELDKSNRLHLTEVLMNWAGLDDVHRQTHFYDMGGVMEIWELGRYREFMTERTPAIKDLARRLLVQAPASGGDGNGAATPVGDGA